MASTNSAPPRSLSGFDLSLSVKNPDISVRKCVGFNNKIKAPNSRGATHPCRAPSYEDFDLAALAPMSPLDDALADSEDFAPSPPLMMSPPQLRSHRLRSHRLRSHRLRSHIDPLQASTMLLDLLRSNNSSESSSRWNGSGYVAVKRKAGITRYRSALQALIPFFS